MKSGKQIKTNKKDADDVSEKDVIEKKFGEVDYAILKSITYGFKNIKEISKVLQIRTMIVEKHVYNLTKAGFIKYFQYVMITSEGKQAIDEFEKNNPENVWKPIEEFILSAIEHNKQKRLMLQKMIDIALLISVALLIILIIYYWIFAI